MPKRPTVIALIPARAGSKRIAGKNVRLLAGHPLIAYTIAAARESGIFDAVLVSTESPHYADIARHYGAEVPFLRSPEMATDSSPDIKWIAATLKQLAESGRVYDCFGILRPTSPLRQSETIRRAWDEFLAEEGIDSLRAVEPVRQHPGKMWVLRGRRLLPLLPFGPEDLPWHSRATQDLPAIYAQNASLEIAWTRVVRDTTTIAGNVVMPFLTRGTEGMDVNTPCDWWYLEHLLSTGEARLPAVTRPPFTGDE